MDELVSKNRPLQEINQDLFCAPPIESGTKKGEHKGDTKEENKEENKEEYKKGYKVEYKDEYKGEYKEENKEENKDEYKEENKVEYKEEYMDEYKGEYKEENKVEYKVEYKDEYKGEYKEYNKEEEKALIMKEEPNSGESSFEMFKEGEEVLLVEKPGPGPSRLLSDIPMSGGRAEKNCIPCPSHKMEDENKNCEPFKESSSSNALPSPHIPIASVRSDRQKHSSHS